MAKTKKKRAKKKAKKKRASRFGKPSSSILPPPDKKYQQQYYVTQDLIDGIELLRQEKEAVLREKLGGQVTLSTSQFVGSVLHDLVKRKQKAGSR